MKIILNTIALLCVGTLTSCTIHHNVVKPLSPGAYMPYEKPFWAKLVDSPLNPDTDKPVPTVESLRPTLKWEAVPGALDYDLIIYTAIPKDPVRLTWAGMEKVDRKRTGFFVLGKEIYYREAVGGTSHVVAEPLAPDSVFVWSVRTRTGTNVSPWATYDFHKGYKVIGDGPGVPGVSGHNWWWPFQTPKQ